MFNSSIIEVAIGMTLVFLLFSLLCSAINEWVARCLNWRGDMLRDGINHLLADDNAVGLAKAIHQHPLVAGLKQNDRYSLAPGLRKNGRYPSYISPSTFAIALMSVAFDLEPPAAAGARIPAAKSKVKLDNKCSSVEIELTTEQKALLTSLTQGVSNVFSLQSVIERWFDGSMERVSGVYKRKTQLLILVSAFVIAAICNVDAIRVARELNRNATLRESLVHRARSLTDKASDPKQIDVAEELSALQLPLGWGSFTQFWSAVGVAREKPSLVASKLFGLFISGVALSLGAPFWFDALNKLVNLRQTGVPPDESNSIVAQ